MAKIGQKILNSSHLDVYTNTLIETKQVIPGPKCSVDLQS